MECTRIDVKGIVRQYFQTPGQVLILRSLARHIRAIGDWLPLTGEERLFRQLQANDIIRRLRNNQDDVALEIIGSQSTGLATPMSDVDIAFDQAPGYGSAYGQDTRVRGRRSQLRNVNVQLSTFKNALQGSFGSCEVVESRRFPLVRIRLHGPDLGFQIVHSDGDINQSAYVIDYLAEYPHAKPIFMLISAALAARSLKNTYNGGLGSYPLFMMIVASFKHSQLSRSVNLVDALVHFLAFIKDLDSKKHGLSIEPPRVFDKLATLVSPNRGIRPRSDDYSVGQSTRSQVL